LTLSIDVEDGGLVSRPGVLLLTSYLDFAVVTPGSVLYVGNHCLIERCNNVMELEFIGAYVFLLGIRFGLVIHVVYIDLEGLLLLKHVVNLETLHKDRIQGIVDYFGSTPQLLQSSIAATF
jgi:hypothetical protein